MTGLIYSELLKRFSVRLFDTLGDPRLFTQWQLDQGWQWWFDQPFNREGYVCERETGKLFRLNSTQEQRGRLLWRVYSSGPALPSYDPGNGVPMIIKNREVTK